MTAIDETKIIMDETQDNEADASTADELAPDASSPANRQLSAAESPFSNGASAGGATLPHRDATAAAAFGIAEFQLSSIPMLPRLLEPGLMPAHSLDAGCVIAQAVAGLRGASLSDGVVRTDTTLLSGADSITVPLDDPSFAGMVAFLDLAAKVSLDGQPVTWHYPGPVTLGGALHRSGLDTATAFALALRVVRTQLTEIAAIVGTRLPNSPQLVMLEEPALADLMKPEFPVPPDHAVDMMSSAMAALSSVAVVGLRCELPCDVATMLASGPGVVSLPVSMELVDWAGYLNRFLEDGGVISWETVPTAGPVASSAERHWRDLSDVWCELVRRGCDPVALRRQTIVTPGGGLGAHSVSVARRIARMNGEIAKRVLDQANATRFALGA